MQTNWEIINVHHCQFRRSDKLGVYQSPPHFEKYILPIHLFLAKIYEKLNFQQERKQNNVEAK